MTPHRPLLLLASLALATSVLGACSQGASSPTEPTLAFDSSAKALSTDFDSVAGDDTSKRHGDDDGSSDDNGGGNGNDDGTADQGRNNGNGNGSGNSGRQGRGRGGDDPRKPGRTGQEFEATVLSVSGNTITLATGTRVLVNGQTQWSARGDLRSLSALAAAVNANRRPRVEGRGARQANGTILAQTIKAEIDN